MSGLLVNRMPDKPVAPGDFIYVGRFRNRPAIVTDISKDEKGTLKYTYEPVPKGRKKPKTRNLLPYKAMNQEDAAKYKKIYDEETAKIRAKKTAGEVTSLKVAARYHQALVMPPRRVVDYITKFGKAVSDLRREWAAQRKALFDTLEEVKRKYSDASWQITEFNKKLNTPILKHYDGFDFDRLLADLDLQLMFFERAQKERAQYSHVRDPQMKDGSVRMLAEHLTALVKAGNPLESAIASIAPNKVDRVLASDDSFEWNPKYEEGVPEDWTIALSGMHAFLDKTHRSLKDTARKLNAFGTGEVNPEPTETLYHASVKARQIMSRGFAKEMPKDQLGLGGSQSGNNGSAISFTYDLKAALEIARSFKEAALIATGQVKASEILNWGIRETHLATFLNMLKVKLEGAFDRRKLSLEGAEIDKMNGHWVVKVNDPDERGVKELDVDDVFTDPKDIFNMYDAYLWSHPTRLNPVHFNRYKLVNYLKTADPRDIGVVSAEVDMTHPDISSHPGEKEFRVPPAAVIAVTKLYQ